MRPKWPGLVGKQCVSLNHKEVWALEICRLSILPYLQNKLGESSQIRVPWQLVLLRRNTSPFVIFSKQI